MTTNYVPGDRVACHTDPVWRQKANFIIRADVSSETEGKQWEQLWVRQLSERRFEICCIPFFVYGLALGDEVETDEAHVVQRVIVSHGHHTFRIWFGGSDRPELKDVVPAVMRDLGCEVERWSENLFAISAPTSATASDARGVLIDYQQAGHLIFERGDAE